MNGRQKRLPFFSLDETLRLNTLQNEKKYKVHYALQAEATEGL
jgi:hypothetical protein